MAHAFYGLNFGQKRQDVVEAAATNATDVEVNIDTAAVANRADALLCLEQIREAIEQMPFPPA